MRKFLNESWSECLSFACPEAFCMIPLQMIRFGSCGGKKQEYTYLSIITIMGATIDAAVNPETQSEANRRPRFFVFHTFASAGDSGTLGVRGMLFGGTSRFN
jgi:hypothetical protein